MPTPLQERVYELLLRVVTVEVDTSNNERISNIASHLFAAAVTLGRTLEEAISAPDRIAFRTHLTVVNAQTKVIKLWLRVLDDLGRIEPEVATPLHDLAEEVQCLVLTALRTSATHDVRRTATLERR